MWDDAVQAHHQHCQWADLFLFIHLICIWIICIPVTMLACLRSCHDDLGSLMTKPSSFKMRLFHYSWKPLLFYPRSCTSKVSWRETKPGFPLQDWLLNVFTQSSVSIQISHELLKTLLVGNLDSYPRDKEGWNESLIPFPDASICLNSASICFKAFSVFPGM